MGIYLKQLLSGRDFALGNPFAAQMVNFSYLIGDDSSRECVIVDPAWDIAGLLDAVDRDHMKLVGALVTHYHPDHVGGNIFGHRIEGLGQLMAERPVKVHVNAEEAQGLKLITGLSDGDLALHCGGDRIQVGQITIEFLHTPGHTPGSQCFLVEGRYLISGDTLFVEGCGRVDLPGGDPEKMYYSLTQVLAKLPDQTILYPGHHYGSAPSSTIGEQRAKNIYLKISNLQQWMRLMKY
jgi:glyoxylase-like metal-dependent hydrolase (beta-lactamase superfamily II)